MKDGTQRPIDVSTKQRGIAEVAKHTSRVVFTAINHHIDFEWMKEAHRRTRKDAAAGIDGMSAEEYGRNLEGNLRSLVDRAKNGEQYRAPPVRRVYIPKADGRQRPLGIPTYEDRLLQRAVLMLLEPIYEQDFLDCSYGFRPGRNQHQALGTVWETLMRWGGGYVIELDIERYFETVDHTRLKEMLDTRVRDGVVRRLIGKWLKAGVMEDGRYRRSSEGTPQGGVISPLLANIYLHEVLDLWFEKEVKPRMGGGAAMVRYADDAVLLFRYEDDAKRVMDVLPKRFEKYGLKVHPAKTRLTRFPRPDNKRGEGFQSFDLLGFRHYWAKSRKGSWVIKKKTASNRLSRALKRISEWCREHRHDKLAEQHAHLSRMLRGHYNYYGVTGNSRSLHSLAFAAERIWFKWLRRRSQRGLTWERYHFLLQTFSLPPPRIVRRST